MMAPSDRTFAGEMCVVEHHEVSKLKTSQTSDVGSIPIARSKSQANNLLTTNLAPFQHLAPIE
jgi:hypothetical protein